MTNPPFPKLSEAVLESGDPKVLRETLEQFYHIAKMLDAQNRMMDNENRTLKVMHRFKYN